MAGTQPEACTLLRRTPHASRSNFDFDELMQLPGNSAIKGAFCSRRSLFSFVRRLSRGKKATTKKDSPPNRSIASWVAQLTMITGLAQIKGEKLAPHFNVH
jgi:hypothetical protein